MLNQGGLAGTGSPDDGSHLAFCQFKINVLKGLESERRTLRVLEIYFFKT